MNTYFVEIMTNIIESNERWDDEVVAETEEDAVELFKTAIAEQEDHITIHDLEEMDVHEI